MKRCVRNLGGDWRITGKSTLSSKFTGWNGTPLSTISRSAANVEGIKLAELIKSLSTGLLTSTRLVIV
jgi:hypothetical protein